MLISKFKCDGFSIRKEGDSDNELKDDKVKVSHVQSKEINKLLSVWKLNQRPNHEIYHELVKPFLMKLL